MFEDSELTALLDARKQSAKNFREVEIEEKWKLASEFYEGKEFGNEVKDRSQVILTEVRDKVEALMPPMLKIFTSGDQIAEFNPVGAEDVELAEQATDLTNHIFMKENDGFIILATMFKDAFLFNNGITKTFAEEVEEVKTEKRFGVLADELANLLDDSEVEILSQEEAETEFGVFTVSDIEVTTENKVTKIRVENVPPEDFFIDGNTMTIKEAPYVSHEMLKTRSDLASMGFDKDQIEDIPSDTRTDNIIDRDDHVDVAVVDPSMEEVILTEHYLLIDMDKTGIARPWKISTAGNEVLDKEKWDGDWPFQSVSPILKPHEFYGTSVAEEVLDIQLIKSTIMRMLMDNTYGLANNRYKVWETQAGQVNIDDVLNNRKDAPIRIRSPKGAADVTPLEVQPIGQIVIPIMEFLDQIAEVRTGVTKFGQGLDADVLQRSPATGVSMVMGAAQEKQQLIARTFAETGVKDIFAAIYKLARKYQAGEKSMRLRGRLVEIDPGKWGEKFDLSIKVGLGTGNQMERTANAERLLALTEKAAGFGYVTEKNAFNAIKTAVESMGFNTVAQYFTSPDTPEGQELQKNRKLRKPPEEKVADQLFQIETAKIQAKQTEIASKQELDQQKFVHEIQKDREEHRLQIQELITKFSLERQELINQTALKVFELKAQMEASGMELGIKTGVEQSKSIADALIKDINIDTRLRAPDV